MQLLSVKIIEINWNTQTAIQHAIKNNSIFWIEFDFILICFTYKCYFYCEKRQKTLKVSLHV